MGQASHAVKKDDGPPLVIRDVTHHDVAFISSTWKKSYKALNAAIAWVPAYQYFHHVNKAVDEILQRSTVKVAADAHDDEAIRGWVCFDPVAIHYIYVKGPFRKLGIAKVLFGATPHRDAQSVRVTHWTEAAEKAAQKERRLIYMPSLLGAK